MASERPSARGRSRRWSPCSISSLMVLPVFRPLLLMVESCRLRGALELQPSCVCTGKAQSSPPQPLGDMRLTLATFGASSLPGTARLSASGTLWLAWLAPPLELECGVVG